MADLLPPPRRSPPIAAAAAGRAPLRPAPCAGPATGGESSERSVASRNEIARWAAAIRTRAPLLCGPEKAIHSAKACIVANEAIQKGQKLKV